MRMIAGLPLRQRLLIGGAAVGLVVVLIAVILIATSSGTDAADDQPIAFSHRIHVTENEIQCQFCHYGVNKSPSAVIPSVEKCMGCHQYIATDSPEIEKLAGYWERQEPIPWIRMNEQPDYVYFSHQPHIAAGVSCGSCHGDVAQMSIAEPVVDMNMGFCLDCHNDHGEKEMLWDCTVCHR
jgi:hypothetical protein